MIDFWNRTIGLTGGLKLTRNQKEQVYELYGVDKQNGGRRKCMFTGLIVPKKGNICIAHLIPRRCPGWAFESLNIDPGHRNHPKNTLVLCKSVKELFDLKLISFYEVEEGQFMMKIWDEKVEEIPIYKNSDQKMRDFKNEVLTLDQIDGKSPYTRILNHHHKMCARFHGDLDTARESSFGTPCKMGSKVDKYPVERMALKTFYYDNPPNKYPNLCSDKYPNPCSDEFYDLCSVTSSKSSLDSPFGPSLEPPPLETSAPVPKSQNNRSWFQKFPWRRKAKK